MPTARLTLELEETTQLEFKRELPPSGKNDDIAKDIAAMANTEGGVIIYGIEEDNAGRAKALTPLAMPGVGERVTLVAQSLDEGLTLRSVTTILADGAADEGFLIVEVPPQRASAAPFQGVCARPDSKREYSADTETGWRKIRSPGRFRSRVWTPRRSSRPSGCRKSG